MSDRSVSVHLKANVAGYIAGIEKAKLATRDLAADAKKSSAEHGQAWEKVGKGMMVTGGVIAAGVGLAVKSFMDFDQSMSRAQAGTGAAGKSLDALRAAAVKAGADTQYSATEAADAITEMGKAGVSSKDILGGGLTGALSLAAAGELDVASASGIAATAMNQFGLAGKDIPHIADLLAAGAGKAMGSVTDLAGALKYTGPTAKGLGISIEETTGTLAMFAQQGLLGEQAGTSLRAVLMTLTSPSAIVAKRMEELGINVYDANGKFVGMQGAAGELQRTLGPLDDATRNAALGQIFGNEAVGAARQLYEGGAGAVKDWTAKVNDAGFAAQQAATLTDNLKGDIERLGGSLSSVLIQSGSATNDMLRTMTKELQGAVDLYGSLPVPVQQGATVLATVAGAAALVTGGLILLAPRIAATKLALADMGRTGALLSGGLSKAGAASKMLGGPLVIATVALGYFAQQAQESKGRVDEMAASLDAQTGAVTDNTRAWVIKNLGESGALAAAKEMGVSVGDVTDAVLGNSDALTRVNAALVVYGQSLAGNADVSTQIDAMNKLKAAIGGGNDELNKGVAAQKLLAEAATTGAGAAAAAVTPTQAAAQSEKDLAAAADAAKKAHDALTASITGYGSAMMTARGDARSYEAAIDAATAAVKKSGETYDKTTGKFKIGTDVQRESEAALDGIATSALKVAESNLAAAEANGTLGRASKSVTGDVNEARDAFIAQAHAMGMPIPAAKKLATQSGLTAGRVKEITDKLIALGKQNPRPTVGVNGLGSSMTALSAWQRYIDGLHGKTVTITTAYKNAQRDTALGRADGGPITGVGGPREDNIPLWGSVGEYMVNAKSTAKHRSLIEAINADKLKDGGLIGGGQYLAAGGAVTAASTLLATGAQYAKGMGAGLTSRQIQSAIDAITKLTAAWKAAVDVAAALAQRADLVRAIAKASKTEMAAARQALTDFDRAAATSRADAKIAAQQASLAARQQLAANVQQVAANRLGWAFDHMSALDQLADVTRRLKAEKQYSDTWITLAKQREGIAAQIADAAKQADAARQQAITDALAAQQALAATRQQAITDAASKLNAMLDTRVGILGQLKAAQDTYSSSVTGANATLAQQTQQLEDARRIALATWAKLDEQVQAGFAPSMSFLVSNAKAQIGQFTAWMEQLDLARRRGVSESVIASLGLDQGPQALTQLKQFNAGTVAQVQELNALVEQKQAQAGAQVAREKAQMLSELGRGLLAAQQQAAEAVAAAQATFMASQAELTTALALVGTDQARSYTDAIAEGLLSGIPAIMAAAAAVQAAMAAAAAPIFSGQPVDGGVIYQGADGIINHAAEPVQSTPYANGQLLYTDPARPWLGTIQTADTAANRAEVARSGGSIVGGYAGGGWVFGSGSGTSDSINAALSNGEFVVNAAAAARNATLLSAVNSGRRITSAPMVSAPSSSVNVAAPQVHVYVDGKEFKGLVRVELAQDRYDRGMSSRRTVNA